MTDGRPYGTRSSSSSYSVHTPPDMRLCDDAENSRRNIGIGEIGEARKDKEKTRNRMDVRCVCKMAFTKIATDSDRDGPTCRF